MTALRRTTTVRGRPMKPIDLETICDQCGKSRAHGNHNKCSKAGFLLWRIHLATLLCPIYHRKAGG